MDPFTENILARARERQKLLKDYSSENDVNKLLVTKTTTSSEPNLKETTENEIVSDHKFDPVYKDSLSEGNIPKFSRQNSKTRVSSNIPGCPQPQLKTLNIQRDNFNMEIKLTSSDNVRVEVEIEDQDQSDDTESQCSESGLREDAKNRLKRLGKLYAGGEEADISSPIHRSQERFDEENNETLSVHIKEKDDAGKGRRGLSRLADLAQTINQWEDDVNSTNRPMSQNTTPKKAWKPPAPQPPKTTSPSKPSHKSKAPEPPKNKSPQKKDNGEFSTPSKEKTIEIVGVTPKQLKWDKAVLDTLESQGFMRTTSSSRLVYSYNSQGKNNKENDEKNTNVDMKSLETITETKETQIVVENTTPNIPKSPNKNQTRTTASKIAERAAIFESSPKTANKSATTKDPALLTVSERKALFEKNKGEALVPKAAFAMSVPTKKTETSNVNKPTVAKGSENIKPEHEKTPVKHNKPPAPKPPVQATNIITQNPGIASKMAALLESKTTISQSQIENNIREERQKEMDLLHNRFNKNKKVQSKEVVVEEEESDDDDDDNDDATEETAMIPEKTVKIIPSAPPMPPVPCSSRKSGEKRSLKASPKVAAVLEDVKRIRVSPPKAGKLYPNLSDIEATTETENENASPSESNNSSFDDNISESDDANTSFGREILQAVCKNQTPQKRPICDESTASDVSSVLDEMDDYLNEALDTDSGPTPPKCGRKSPTTSQAAAQPSHSFNYKNFNSPLKPSPKKSIDLPTYVVEGENVLPLTHTVSFYRKQQNEASKTPVRQISRHPIIEENPQPQKSDDYEVVRKKIIELQEEVNKQQMIISQTSQALNLCNCTPEFSGSTEQVEAEKVLLVSTHRRQAALQELQRLKVEGTIRPCTEHAQNLPLEKGTLTISNIVLPMKQKYVTALAATGGKGHHVVCLIKCGEQVFSTKLVSTVASKSKNPDLDLCIPGTIELKNIYSDFTITFEVYCLQAQEEYLPHEVKYHINNKKASNKLTPKKGKQESRLIMPLKESPAGPQAVRSPSFALMGYVIFSVQAISKRVWSLINTPAMSPLEGSVEMKIACELAVSIEHRGFLTMFEDVSGFGAWHRRWCLLKGHTLSYWKYPDDERKMPPIDSINLKNCITKEVGPVSRDICARLHTFLLERERIAHPQDKDTLVMVCKGDKTIIRHLLSADTKEERIEWCQKFNAALTATRMWGK